MDEFKKKPEVQITMKLFNSKEHKICYKNDITQSKNDIVTFSQILKRLVKPMLQQTKEIIIDLTRQTLNYP